MRLLTVHPGASYATAEVHNGLIVALREQGVEVHVYDLESRLLLAGQWLNWVWRKQGRPKEKYNDADVAYGASKDVIERALRWDVDGVLVVSAMFLHPDLLVLLRRAHMPTALVLTESPYDDFRQRIIAPFVDLLWTNERLSVEPLSEVNPNTHYLPHAYDPAVHQPDKSRDPDDVPSHDVVLVGSLFGERGELLGSVDWSGIDLGLYGDWRGLGSRHKLRQYVRGGITDNRQAAALYRHAKIGLNLYRQSIGWGSGAPRIDQADSLNPRALELAACGCFQISEPRAEVVDYFGDSVATFRDADELGQLIRHYLAHPLERQRRAARACEAIRGRTFAAMAATILADADRSGWPAPRREFSAWRAITAVRDDSTPLSLAPAPLSLSPA